jgi:hypothetical protein
MATSSGRRQMPKPSARPDDERRRALSSFVGALYDEMDKLAKKSPREALSDLAMARVNRAVRDAKEIIGAFDPYVGDVSEFVAAGDNPEARDAVLVLAEIRAALHRVQVKYQKDPFLESQFR